MRKNFYTELQFWKVVLQKSPQFFFHSHLSKDSRAAVQFLLSCRHRWFQTRHLGPADCTASERRRSGRQAASWRCRLTVEAVYATKLLDLKAMFANFPTTTTNTPSCNRELYKTKPWSSNPKTSSWRRTLKVAFTWKKYQQTLLTIIITFLVFKTSQNTFLINWDEWIASFLFSKNLKGNFRGWSRTSEVALLRIESVILAHYRHETCIKQACF